MTLHNGQRVFVKAISAKQTPEGPAILRSEARVAAALPDHAPVPRHLWTFDDGTWVAVAFEDIDGHQPQQPWVHDELRRVLAAVNHLATTMTPAPIAAPRPIDGKASEFVTWRRWSTQPPDVSLVDVDTWLPGHVDRLADLEGQWSRALEGDTLLHCDLRADNILLRENDVIFVDWPSARIGAAWSDLLFMLPSLGMHGIDLHQIVETHPIFHGVDPGAVNSGMAAIAGSFIGRSLLPPPIGLPTVRGFQLAQGRAALRFLRDRMD